MFRVLRTGGIKCNHAYGFELSARPKDCLGRVDFFFCIARIQLAKIGRSNSDVWYFTCIPPHYIFYMCMHISWNYISFHFSKQ